MNMYERMKKPFFFDPLDFFFFKQLLLISMNFFLIIREESVDR